MARRRPLRSLDRNQDERVQSQEIPGTIAVGFVRGNAQNNNNLFAAPALPVANREDAELVSRYGHQRRRRHQSARVLKGRGRSFSSWTRTRTASSGSDEISSLVDESEEAD